MTDRELLELAAKAAGIDIVGWVDDGPLDIECLLWNPLTDDGDALRLAVKLGLALNIRRNDVFAGNGMYGVKETMDSFDPYAATRRAIVRATAEIGKEMK
jgi:hypothetical protein